MPGEENGLGGRALPRLILTAALVALAAPAHAADRGYTLTSFDRIRVEGPYAVTLVTGRPVSARATGDAQALDRLSMRVEGRTLTIRPERTQSGFASARGGPVTVAVTTPELDTAILLGSGSLDIERLRAPRLVLSVEGSGRLSARGIETDNADLAIAGSGRIEATGRARMASAIARGSAEIAAAGLQVADLKLIAETASPVALTATRSARVTSSGAGAVEIGGGASCEVKQTGIGPVRCGSNQRQLR